MQQLHLERFYGYLEAQKQMLLKGMTPEQAEMAAFEMNAKDASRLHGK